MRKRLIILLALLALSLTAAAQDATGTPESEPSPFLSALSRIPDTALVREAAPLFSYADYRAALASRGIETPETLAAFLDDREAYGPILPALPVSGPENLLTYLIAGGADYPATVGFDFFDVAQGIQVGMPPGAGQILIGDFSADAVEAAYTARSYTIEDEGDSGVLLCPEAGCESGAQIDFRNRLPGNPFGGDLGRSEPVFVTDGVLLNSPHLPMLEAMSATAQGEAPSLADAPEFQAVANTLAAYPHVMSVIAVSPLSLGTIDFSFAGDEAQAQLSKGLAAQLESMPLAPYQLAAFASAADDTSEYGLALLVYVNAEAAQQAAASIDARLQEMRSFRQPERTYAEILGNVGTLEPSTVVTDDATGLSVVVVQAANPLPSNEPGDSGLVMGSHLLYRRFYEMIISRDSSWLIWGGGTE